MTRVGPHKLDDDGHAVDRFIERYFPTGNGPAWEEACRRLNAIRCRAEFREDIPDEGQEIWVGREDGSVSDVLMVVRDGVVTTCLWPGSSRPEDRRRPYVPSRG